MDFIKKYWVLLLLLAVVAYFVYQYWQKSKAGLNQLAVSPNNSSSPIKSLVSVVSPKSGTIITAPPVQGNIVNSNSSSWQIGDKLYAGSTGVNTYSSPSATSSNVVKFYKADTYIGTYLGKENGFIKIITSEFAYSWSSLLTGYQSESNKVVYSLANQLYSK